MSRKGNTEIVKSKAFGKFVSLIPESVKERLFAIRQKIMEGSA